MKNLRNYTSGVPASQSINQIKIKLQNAGAIEIVEIPEKQNPLVVDTLRFSLAIKGEPSRIITYHLPSRREKVYNLLIQRKKRINSTTEANVRAQSARTAWKNMLDWVDLQLTLTSYEQAELAEVFLPYMYDPEKPKNQ